MTPHPDPAGPRLLATRLAAAATTLALLLLVFAPTAQATHDDASCEQDGKNTQCNSFASVAMDTQTEVRGEPVTVEITSTVHDTQTDKGARYVMFSVRHDPAGGSSPVSLELKEFSTDLGPIFTERIDHDVPNEINVWAHVADIPEGEEITLKVEVGVSERGAFQLETLIMPFDRGYEPLRDRSGDETTAFSSTMLGVNEETATVGSAGGGFVDRLRTPGLPIVGLLAALAAAGFLWRRRK